MKAAVLEGKGLLTVREFPCPPMDDNSVKIAVAYCGICGTDLHKFAGRAGSRPVTYPVPLGHEASGIVTEVGKNVRGFAPGDRVTVDPNWHCGKCFYCQNGKPHLCTASRGVVKGMAEFICPPEENVYHLPEGLSLKDACLAEPLACCLHGVDLLDPHPGDTVAIVGFGAIGSMMLQLISRVSGTRIAIVEAVEAKREAALRAGAGAFVCPKEGQSVREALKDAGVEHIDRVIECVGLPVTAETALDIADRGATVVLFGVGAPEAVAGLRLYDCFTKELVIKFSYINPATTGRALRLLADGGFSTDGVVSAVIPLEDVPEEIASRRLCSRGKVVVRIGEEKA